MECNGTSCLYIFSCQTQMKFITEISHNTPIITCTLYHVYADQPSSSVLLSAGAYIPEESFMGTDLSLPKYTFDDSLTKAKADPTAPKQAAAPKMKKGNASAADVAKEEAIAKRKQADFEKARAAKEEKAALQAKRLAQRGKIAVPKDD